MAGYKEPKLNIETDKRSRVCLSKNLIKYRKRVDISREGLAINCEMDVKYLSRIENCSANASLDVLDKLSDGTGIAAEDLIADYSDTESDHKTQLLGERYVKENYMVCNCK